MPLMQLPLWEYGVAAFVLVLLIIPQSRSWVKARLARMAQRIALWFLALFFTFFGPFSSAMPDWSLTIWAQHVNAEKSFRDVILAMVGMIVLSASDVVDNLMRRYSQVSLFTQIFGPIILVAYFIAVASGIWGYSKVGLVEVPDDQFKLYWTIIWDILWFGVAVEVLIAVEDADLRLAAGATQD